MATFAYTARDTAGKTVSAAVTAGTRKEALRLLATRGLQVLNLSESATTGAVLASPKQFKKSVIRMPQSRDLLPFLQALTELTTSGL